MPTTQNPERLPEQPSRALQESGKKERSALEEETAERKGVFGHLWDTITYIPRKLFGVAVRHPVKTALVAGLLLYFGTPWLMRFIGRTEGNLASVPQGYILRHLRTIFPLGNSIPPSPIPETIPPGGFS